MNPYTAPSEPLETVWSTLKRFTVGAVMFHVEWVAPAVFWGALLLSATLESERLFWSAMGFMAFSCALEALIEWHGGK